MAARRRLIEMQSTIITGDIFDLADKIANYTINGTTGEPLAENGMVLTEFIEIVPESEYVYTITSNSTGARTRRFACYDSGRNYISTLVSQSWMNAGQTYTTTVQMPGNAKYARLCALNTDNVSAIGKMVK